ncbi:type I-E CRISPR-associated protein Cas6/Cse3/CasE [Phytomonospora endophytica]|uniref:CRISPR system Cascade subunit CasE n=1 Tax=Phytomonospora endophytica TaxID=714109 RepID=A0A841FY23_9ACTN|nr:type I-E CRISPR-associated protein Cas6/Cse3/CasE [Phytomonospora endophytica]MBB6038618.1 CRISPR system Cascade subunit CasE [Phytomonospora endophytica]GIG69238.1 type I-E CRISPR-associated protein Cas6/Cse3/CasE [Phytomonospora endophytica]
MWLTRITPDLNRRDTHDDLADTVKMHQRVMTLAEDGLGDQARQRAGILYRIETTPDGVRLLVQTREEPRIEQLPDGYGTSETHDLQPQLDALTAGMSLDYRIAANATKRLATVYGAKAGKLTMLSGEEAEDWWRQRAEANGLHVETLTSARQESARSGDQRRPIKHTITRFDGSATVTDPDLLRTAVEDGIGRAKAYGCGLLSLTLNSA